MRHTKTGVAARQRATARQKPQNWAYLLQTHEIWLDAHWHGFRVFEGVPGCVIYDNMRRAGALATASPTDWARATFMS